MQIKFSLIVLLGAVSYGVLSTFVKLAYGAGYQVNEVVGSQFFMGWLMLVLAVLLFSRRRVKVKKVWRLILVGTTMSITGITYYSSLQYVPASMAIILLFQFTWMGVAVEAVISRRLPSRMKLLSIAILIVGTLLASGILTANLQELPVQGILLGLCAAASFTLFILVSEKVGTDLPPLLKSSLMITGAMVFSFLVFPPVFLLEGTLFQGLWKYALPLAFFGMVVPTVCFAWGMPKIGTGLGTILSAAELPTVIIMSWLVLKEDITLLQYLGVGIIIIGICIPQIKELFSSLGLARKRSRE